MTKNSMYKSKWNNSLPLVVNTDFMENVTKITLTIVSLFVNYVLKTFLLENVYLWSVTCRDMLVTLFEFYLIKLLNFAIKEWNFFTNN